MTIEEAETIRGELTPSEAFAEARRLPTTLRYVEAIPVYRSLTQAVISLQPRILKLQYGSGIT